MKKRNEFDEFLRQLEEAIDEIIDGIEIPENRPVNIELSINLCPLMVFRPDDIVAQPAGKTPVDVLETEKNIHAVIALPGMEKGNINLTCRGTALEITANNAEKTVTEAIELPARVNKTGMSATYNNGILEVIFNKRKARKFK